MRQLASSKFLKRKKYSFSKKKRGLRKVFFTSATVTGDRHLRAVGLQLSGFSESFLSIGFSQIRGCKNLFTKTYRNCAKPFQAYYAYVNFVSRKKEREEERKKERKKEERQSLSMTGAFYM
jgi:hypothetical protein